MTTPPLKLNKFSNYSLLYSYSLHLHYSHLADTFIQSDLQMRTMEAIKINKRAMIGKSYDRSQLA